MWLYILKIKQKVWIEKILKDKTNFSQTEIIRCITVALIVLLIKQKKTNRVAILI